MASKSDAGKDWYERHDAAGDLVGFVAKSGSGNPDIQLTYVSYADLAFHPASAGASTSRDDRYQFAFGILTPVVSQPKSGSATYTGIARGYGSIGSLNNYLGTVSGSSRLAANFAEGMVTLTLVLNADDASKTALGSFALNGVIGTNKFGGSGLSGNFYGPSANEFGAAWKVSNSALQMDAAGVAVGKKD